MSKKNINTTIRAARSAATKAAAKPIVKAKAVKQKPLKVNAKPTKSISEKDIMNKLLAKPLSRTINSLITAKNEVNRAKISRSIKRAAREYALNQTAVFGYYGKYKVYIVKDSCTFEKSGTSTSITMNIAEKSNSLLMKIAKAIVALSKTKAYQQ